MRVTVISVAAAQIAIRLFGDIAVVTDVLIAQLLLPDGSTFQEHLALTNVFRQSSEAWHMVVAHLIVSAQETATRATMRPIELGAPQCLAELWPNTRLHADAAARHHDQTDFAT